MQKKPFSERGTALCKCFIYNLDGGGIQHKAVNAMTTPTISSVVNVIIISFVFRQLDFLRNEWGRWSRAHPSSTIAETIDSRQPASIRVDGVMYIKYRSMVFCTDTILGQIYYTK